MRVVAAHGRCDPHCLRASGLEGGPCVPRLTAVPLLHDRAASVELRHPARGGVGLGDEEATGTIGRQRRDVAKVGGDIKTVAPSPWAAVALQDGTAARQPDHLLPARLEHQHVAGGRVYGEGTRFVQIRAQCDRDGPRACQPDHPVVGRHQGGAGTVDGHAGGSGDVCRGEVRARLGVEPADGVSSRIGDDDGPPMDGHGGASADGLGREAIGERRLPVDPERAVGLPALCVADVNALGEPVAEQVEFTTVAGQAAGAFPGDELALGIGRKLLTPEPAFAVRAELYHGALDVFRLQRGDIDTAGIGGHCERSEVGPRSARARDIRSDRIVRPDAQQIFGTETGCFEQLPAIGAGRGALAGKVRPVPIDRVVACPLGGGAEDLPHQNAPVIVDRD
jgi:hypothetical protein